MPPTPRTAITGFAGSVLGRGMPGQYVQDRDRCHCRQRPVDGRDAQGAGQAGQPDHGTGDPHEAAALAPALIGQPLRPSRRPGFATYAARRTHQASRWADLASASVLWLPPPEIVLAAFNR